MSLHEGLKFLRDLHFEHEPDGWIELRAFGNDGGRKQDWFKDPTRMLDWVERLDKRSTGPAIFFGVGKRSGKGGSKEDVLSMPAVWADIDTGKLGLDWKSVARHLYDKPKFVRPSAIIHSGNGLHAYWYLNEQFVLDGSAEIEHVEKISAKVQRAMASDYVHDVSRVMRLPGTYNNKNRGKPSRAFIVYSDWWDRYDLDQIDKAFTGLTMQIEGVKPVEKESTDPRDAFAWMKEPGANGKKPNVETRLAALWDRTRYHGDGGDMRSGYLGINQAITFTTCLYYCSPTGGYSNDDSIVEMTLKWVKQRKEIDAPGEDWNWNDEKEMIRDCLERWKPKWQTIKSREELERKAARKKAKEAANG